MFYGVLNRLRTISSCYPRTVIQISKQQQCLSTKVQSPSEKDPESSEKKKKRFIPKITLLQQEAITITTLEEAQKLSKRRDLKLVKLTDLDTKTQRPVYKLMTGSEYHQEELKQRELRKKEKGSGDILRGDKVLILNSVISQHDLSTHVNKIRKWLTKKYEVRISINCDASVEKGEEVYSYLEANLRNESRFLQKRLKNNEIKFQIIPLKSTTESSEKL